MKLFLLLALFTGCLSTPIQQGSQINADGSYSFFFDNNQREGRQFRDETRASDGTVVGKYGYQDPSGALRIVKYTAGKDGFVAAGDSGPVVVSGPGQPLVYSAGQPVMVEPAPLTYGNQGTKGGSQLTERDQQTHITVEEDNLEAKEEASDEEVKPDEEANVESEPNADLEPKEPETDESKSDTPSSPLSAKSPKKQSSVQDDDQTFPQVLSGKRRLAEPQPEQGVKGKNTQPLKGIKSPVAKHHIIYHNVQHGVPVSVQDQGQVVGVPVSHLVPNVQTQVLSAVKRPVIQYQISQPHAIKQILTPLGVRTVQIVQSGAQQQIGDQRQVQYVIQPIIPQNIGLEQRQVVLQPDVQQQVQVLSGIQGIGVYQRPVVDQRYFSVLQGSQQVANIDERKDVLHVVQPEQVQQVGVDQRQVHLVSGVQDIGKHDILGQRRIVLKPNTVQHIGLVSDQRHVPVVQSGVHDIGSIKVVQQSVRPLSAVNNQKVNQVIGYQYVVPTEKQSGEHVLVQSPHRIQNVGYQLRQPAQQYVSVGNSQLYSGVQQQNPISDLQAYYQSIRDSQVSQIGQIGQIGQPVEDQYVPQYVPSVIQPVQYSGIQGVQGIQDPIRRVDSYDVRRQPDLSIYQRPRSQTYGTKSIVQTNV